MPDTKELYEKHSQRVCKSLNSLKSCLKEVSSIDDQSRKKNGIWADQIQDRNTHFDKFRGSETIGQ
jgi:phage-related protein